MPALWGFNLNYCIINSMSGFMIPNKQQNNSGLLFTIFSIWTFIILCRPQDYLSFLDKMRPGLTLGLITLSIYFLSSNKNEKISSDSQFRLYRYLIVLMIIGVPFSYYKSASLKDLFDYASITTMFYFLFYQLVNSIEKLLRLLFVYCLGIAIYAIYIMKFGNFSDGRISFGNMFDPNDIAFFIISFITFNFLFLAKDNKAYVRIVATINILISLIVILKTGSRGGFLALITVFAYLLFAKTKTVKVSFITKAVMVIVAIMSLQFVTMDTKRLMTVFDLQDDYNVTDEQGRVAIWKTGMKLMLTHPLTGIGFNRFPEGVGREREILGLPPRWQTAHNSLVQIGTETGVFGFFLFFALSYNALKIFRQIANKSKNDELIKIGEMASAGFIGHFICAMFISQAYSMYWAFYIVLSAVLRRILINENDNDGLIVSKNTVN
jgi:O-antigen ligase